MPQIIPIKDLKDTTNVSALCHRTDEPIYVTKNGYGDMVLMSMETFQSVSDALKMYQSLLTSEKQITEGKTHDAKESLGKLRSKYGL